MANYDSDPVKVKAVQTAINAAGYMPQLAVDGAYGPKTAAGVKWYQGQHGLTQDGIIGDATMAATIAAVPGSGAPALIPPVLSLPGAISLVNSLNPAAPLVPMPAPAPSFTPPASSGPNLPLLGLPPVMPATLPPAAMAFVPPAAAALVKPPVAAKSQIPVWAGTAAGLVVGVAGGAIGGSVLAGALIGGALGGAVDMVRSALAPSATMHGESMFGMDVNFDDTEGVIAGEIGLPSRDTCALKS